MRHFQVFEVCLQRTHYTTPAFPFFLCLIPVFLPLGCCVLFVASLTRLIKLGLSIDEDDAAADEGEDDIPDLDDAEGDEESTMEQVD